MSYAVLGLLSAVASVAFTDSLHGLRAWFKRFTIVVLQVERIEFDGTLQMSDRLTVPPPDVGKDQAVPVVGESIVRIQFQRTPGLPFRLHTLSTKTRTCATNKPRFRLAAGTPQSEFRSRLHVSLRL